MAAAAVCRIARDFCWRDFFKPSGLSPESGGNQQASYVSRFIFPGKTPFAVYFQYAGEDTSNGGSYLLGSASLTAGIDIPRLARYSTLPMRSPSGRTFGTSTIFSWTQ